MCICRSCAAIFRSDGGLTLTFQRPTETFVIVVIIVFLLGCRSSETCRLLRAVVPSEAVAEEAEPAKEPGERPSKRRCFWEYRRSRETATKKKLGGDVRWSLSWSSSTLPSTLYRREGERRNPSRF